MEPPCTAVVARSLPRLEHRIDRRVGHAFNGGKRLDHPLPVQYSSAHLGLLKQDLAQQDGPRVVGLTPGQITLMSIVPIEQGLLVVCVKHAPSSSGFGGFWSSFSGGFGRFDLGIVGLDLLPNKFGNVLDFHLCANSTQAVGHHG